MYFPQIQLPSLLPLLFLTFCHLFKTKQNKKTGLFIKFTLRNIPPEKNISLRPPRVHCGQGAVQNPLCASEQTASCGHSRVHESKDYQSWRDPGGCYPVQPCILKMGKQGPKRGNGGLDLRARSRVPTLRPHHTAPKTALRD